MLEEALRFTLSVVLVGIASAAITVTLTQAVIFGWLRSWFEEVPILNKLVNCPYCAAHWISLVLAFQIPRSTTAGIPGYLLTVMILVGVTTLFVGAINKALSQIQ